MNFTAKVCLARNSHDNAQQQKKNERIQSSEHRIVIVNIKRQNRWRTIFVKLTINEKLFSFFRVDVRQFVMRMLAKHKQWFVVHNCFKSNESSYVSKKTKYWTNNQVEMKKNAWMLDFLKWRELTQLYKLRTMFIYQT